jgi:hypothetical protein
MFRQPGFQLFDPRSLAVVVAVAFGLADGSPAWAEPSTAGTSGRIIELEATLGAPSPRQEHYFGYAVAVSGDWIVVGEQYDDSACPGQNPCNSSGAAYVYHRAGQTWQFSQKLRASDPKWAAQLGFAVGIDADTIVVGAPYAAGSTTEDGAIYVFVHDGSTWQEQEKVVRQLPNNARFGASVAISGDLVVVGTPGRGYEAYAFRRSFGTWALDATFVPWDGAYQYFGNAVAVSGETVAVTSTEADAPGTLDSGAAYVFRRVGGVWAREAKVVPDLPIYGSQFGSSVSLLGDRLAVGALGEKAFCQPFVCYPGAAYIFARNGSF